MAWLVPISLVQWAHLNSRACGLFLAGSWLAGCIMQGRSLQQGLGRICGHWQLGGWCREETCSKQSKINKTHRHIWQMWNYTTKNHATCVGGAWQLENYYNLTNQNKMLVINELDVTRWVMPENARRQNVIVHNDTAHNIWLRIVEINLRMQAGKQLVPDSKGANDCCKEEETFIN